MRRASHQIDLLDPHVGDLSDLGWCTTPLALDVRRMSDEARAVVEKEDLSDADRAFVDEQAAKVSLATREAVVEAFAHDRVPVVLGGDHSVAYAGIEAALALHDGLDGVGVLQIDAHADLRKAYEGFRSSHASIIRNVVEAHPGVKVFQLGIRDFCDDERDAIERFDVTTVFDRTIADARLRGQVPVLLERLVDALPQKVWLTVDIDGLDPTLCPNTGTPVPGGLLWAEMVELLELLSARRTLIGADLVEVSPGRPLPDEDTWDAIVGARLLYKMLGAIAKRSRPSLPERL
jgi:agmatinase